MCVMEKVNGDDIQTFKGMSAAQTVCGERTHEESEARITTETSAYMKLRERDWGGMGTEPLR